MNDRSRLGMHTIAHYLAMQSERDLYEAHRRALARASWGDPYPPFTGARWLVAVVVIGLLVIIVAEVAG